MITSIPKEVYEKYYLADIEYYEFPSDFYQTFLIQTDYIVLKVFEGSATWEDYPNIREYREFARQQLRATE